MSAVILPAPQRMIEAEGSFTLGEHVRVWNSPEATSATQWLRERLWMGASIVLEHADRADADLILDTDADFREGEYRLDVSEDGIRITGEGAVAVQHGAVSLMQLLPPSMLRCAVHRFEPVIIPAVSIHDWPEFQWRGVMLDVARHFLPKADVLRNIDLLALHKFNRLHLHLTDDQGWRIEIRAYPRLTDIGAWRHQSQVGADDATAPENARPHGGYYTQDDLREIVAYAQRRGIVVVPEIDLPGHSQAAIAAYPELGIPDASGAEPLVHVLTRWGVSKYPLNAEESTITFFKTVLDEVMEIFPSRFIGLGGDECPTEPWERDARSRLLAKERGLDSPAMLQAWIINQLRDHLQQRDRRMLAWDEVLEYSEDPGGIVLGWRGDIGIREALRRDIPVVACPDDQLYFDYRQSDDTHEPIGVGVVVDLATVHAFHPIPEGTSDTKRSLVLGAQANLWSEHLDSPRSIDYMLWPRAIALSEVLWHGPGGDFAEFMPRLESHLSRLDALGVEYRPQTGPPAWFERPGVGTRTLTREQRAKDVADLTAGVLR